MLWKGNDNKTMMKEHCIQTKQCDFFVGCRIHPFSLIFETRREFHLFL